MIFTRKFSRIEKIILIGVAGFAVFILFFWLYMKRKNKDFYVPLHYVGWVTIRYGVPNQPPLPLKNGIIQVKIPISGVLETSTVFEDGWGRDKFFTYDSLQNYSEIPRYIQDKDKVKKWIHYYFSHIRSFYPIVDSLPASIDTTFYEGTRIVKLPGHPLYYGEGRKSIETFYLSTTPQDLLFNPPPNPDSTILVPRLKKKLTNQEKKP
jgi:hypothetical protein